jgi:N-acetylneuraminic acid mutarotase
MKIAFKLLALVIFGVWMNIFYCCKKNPDIPTLMTTNISLITTSTAISGGTITDDGGAEVTLRGTCWNTSENPTTADSTTSDGNGTGTFSSILVLLTPGTKYYIRAFATNTAGTAYGNQISFTTNQNTAILPILTTTDVISITSTSAVSGGNITDAGGDEITAEGVCWGTTADPTISNNKTHNISATGNFISILSGLNPNTTYYIRAYAFNKSGAAYGNQLSFTTTFAQGGSWTKKADFPGVERYGAAGFSVGIKAYVGMGYTQYGYVIKDFWEWDQATDVWTRKADFPGNSTSYVVCFSIGTKGYIGTGTGAGGFTNEFWEFDPVINSWTQKTSLPTTPARAYAVGFSIGNKGYIGLGLKAAASLVYYNDFWEWDQETNIWTEKANFAGILRNDAVGFSIGNIGYIGTGSVGYFGSADSKEFWEWDQASDAWTKKSDFGGTPRGGAVGFSIGNKGYIGTGIGGNLNKDFWEWNKLSDQWKEIANFEGKARASAVGFSIGNKGYIITGGTGSTVFKDFWELTPP